MTDRRLRIVVSTPTFLPTIGGAELGIHEIYSRLAKKHDITIVTPRLSQKIIKNYGADDYGDANYEVRHPLSPLEWICPDIMVKVLHRTSLSYLIALAALRRRQRIDVLNFHYIEPHGIALILMRKLLRTPVVLSLVGRTDVLQLLPPLRWLYARLVISSSNAVIPNTAFYLQGDQFEHVQVIPYGVDITAFSPQRRDTELRSRLGVPENGCLLLSVQRLASIKRVDVLIRAMVKIVEQDKDAVLVLVGHGDEEESLRRLTSHLGLMDNVIFAGYVTSEALPAYFGSADIFVFHSMLETFGIVFAQAMASGLPIVAANTSCVPDVVLPGNGILVEPFDTDSLCDAVMSLMNDPTLRQTIGRRNRARAEQEFDWDIIAGKYEQILTATTGR